MIFLKIIFSVRLIETWLLFYRPLNDSMGNGIA